MVLHQPGPADADADADTENRTAAAPDFHREDYSGKKFEGHPSLSALPVSDSKATEQEYDPSTHNRGLATAFCETSLATIRMIITDSDGSIPSGISRCLVEVATDLRLWAGHAKSESFENCLAVSADLQCNVIELLCSLGKCILSFVEQHDWRAPDNGDPHNDHTQTGEVTRSLLQKQANELSILVDKARVMLDDSDDATADTASDLAQIDRRDTCPDETMEDMLLYVELLKELSPTLEHAEAMMKWAPVLSKPKPKPELILLDISPGAHPYISQIRDKFPAAPDFLIKRLGEANWQRFVKLREKDEPEIVEEIRVPFKPASTFYDSGLGASFIPSRPQSTAQISDTASHGSLVSSLGSQHLHRNRVPREPDEVAEGKPFDCQFCGSKVHGIRSRAAWKHHVYQDIRPYICTFTDCPDWLLTYPTREAWASHEIQNHLKEIEYRCVVCAKDCGTEQSLIHHLDSHGLHLSQTQWNTYVELGKDLRPASETNKCKICGASDSMIKEKYIRHVAQHMEEIALSTIPRDLDTEDEESNSSDAENNPRDDVDIDALDDLNTDTPLDTDIYTLPDLETVQPKDKDTTGLYCNCGEPIRQTGLEFGVTGGFETLRCIACGKEHHVDCAGFPISSSSVGEIRCVCKSCRESGTKQLKFLSEASETLSESSHGFPFACSLCRDAGIEKRFIRRHELSAHLKKHNPPFMCRLCQEAGIEKRFRYGKDLTRHIRVHHDPPPQHFCSSQGCIRAEGGIPFQRQDDLRRHEKSEHTYRAQRRPLVASLDVAESHEPSNKGYSPGTSELSENQVSVTESGCQLASNELPEESLTRSLSPKKNNLICPFQVLNCDQTYSQLVDFKMHVFSHFRQYPPPSYASCFICQRSYTQQPHDNSTLAWNEMLDHMAEDHYRGTQETVRFHPAVAVMRYMWDNNIISSNEFMRVQHVAPETCLSGAANAGLLSGSAGGLSHSSEEHMHESAIYEVTANDDTRHSTQMSPQSTLDLPDLRRHVHGKKVVREEMRPGEGLCYVYEDGTWSHTFTDRDPVNPNWGNTKAGKPRRRLGQACETCRQKKIKCDPGYPRCVQCQRFDRECRYEPGAGYDNWKKLGLARQSSIQKLLDETTSAVPDDSPAQTNQYPSGPPQFGPFQTERADKEYEKSKRSIFGFERERNEEADDRRSVGRSSSILEKGPPLSSQTQTSPELPLEDPVVKEKNGILPETPWI